VSQRIERVDALLREEIGRVLATEVKDPGVGFVTVTEVEASPDLRHARVWVSVIGGPDEQRAALRALGRAMPFVRRQLGDRLRLKRIPDLHVHLDDSMSRATRVFRILDELERGETPEGAPVDQALPTPVARLPRAGDAAGLSGPDDAIAAGPSDTGTDADGVSSTGPGRGAAAPLPRARTRGRRPGRESARRQRRGS
jgi:ribosome-binding factor A